MDEKELKIYAGSAEVFMKYGIKSVNMDDVARNLGVSKKTLYKYVKDKADLLRKSMNLLKQEEHRMAGDICTRGLNAIDEMFEISQMVVGMLQNMHPSIHFDMEKYYPEIWKTMSQDREEFVYGCMKSNLVKGIKEGLYRDDIDPDIHAKIYIAKIDVIFDGEVFPPNKYSFAAVYMEYFRYHIRGLASAKGISYLVEKIKKETNKN